MSATYLRLQPGVAVSHKGHRYLIKAIIDTSMVFCLDEQGTDHKVLKVSELEPWKAEETKAKVEDVVSINESRLETSDKRYERIRGLLEMKHRTRNDVEEVAKAAGVDPVTIYRWIARYENTGSSLGLVPFKRGRVADTVVISKEAEEIIRALIESQFLTGQKISPAKFIKNVKKACAAANVKSPHGNTVRLRLKTIPGIIRATRRGTRREIERHTATPGTNPQGSHLFSDYQVDHTELPIVIVDDKNRQSIRRPWISVVIEVKSRVVAGFYISLDPPSTQSVAMAIHNAFCPKEDFLARLEVDADWPVWGLPGTIHADNALEFRGKGLVYGCKQHQIDLQWRPVKRPNYGAHIERLIGSLGTELTSWSGATFSGISQKADYDPVGNAIYTFKEVEQSVAIWLTKVYHQSRHEGIEKRTPMGLFKELLIGDYDNPGVGMPDRPLDPDRILVDFMRVETRAITPSGVTIDNIPYYTPELRPFIGEKNRWDDEHDGLYLFRIDDRAISPIHFFDPKNKEYIQIPYADKSRPIISTWQRKAAKEAVEAKGLAEVNESSIFQAYDELERLAAQAENSTKTRRQEQRRIEKDRSVQNVGPKSKPAQAAAGADREDQDDDLDDALPPPVFGAAKVIRV